MRRGGFGQESSDQPGKKEVPITPVIKVLHPAMRTFIGLALAAGGVASLFLWDWRYLSTGLILTLGGLIVGPWRDPQEPYITGPDPNFRPDLGDWKEST